MDGVGHYLLAGAALPLEQYRGATGAQSGHQFGNALHFLALADDPIVGVPAEAQSFELAPHRQLFQAALNDQP